MNLRPLLATAVLLAACGDVEHAKTADLATRATTADSATTATSATSATTADSSTTATTATSATTATTATNAEQLGGRPASDYATTAALAGKLDAVTAAAPLAVDTTDATHPAVSIAQASATSDGYLAKEDFAAFGTGAIGAARLPATVAYLDQPNTFVEAVAAPSFAGNGAQLTELSAANVTTGTLSADRLPGNVAFLDSSPTFTGSVTASAFTGNGAGLTNMSAASISSGTLAAGRLPATVAFKDASNTFTGSLTATSFIGDGSALTGVVPANQTVTLAKLAKDSCQAGQVIRRKADDTGWECVTLPTVSEGPWARIAYDDFETSTTGWNQTATTTCTGSRALGPASGTMGINGTNGLSRTYTNLPAHRSIRIRARYHFFDTWDNERARVLVDGQEVWSKTYGIGLTNGVATNCGLGVADYLDYPIEIELAHTGSSLALTFTGSIEVSGSDESFAIDDVAVFVSATEPGWRFITADRMDVAPTAAWSTNTLSGVGNGNANGLGLFGNSQVNKVFDLGATTPSYRQVRIRAEVIAIDAWSGQTVNLRANGAPSASPGFGSSDGTLVWSQNLWSSQPTWIGGGTADPAPVQIDEVIDSHSRYLWVNFGGTGGIWLLRNVEILVR